MTLPWRDKLREITERIPSALRSRWELQTSNSFRRIGCNGDGDVLCAVRQPSDGHPDLHARPEVLDYIVAAQPSVVLALLDEIDRLRAEQREHALDKAFEDR